MNPEHVKIVKRGAAAIAAWRMTHKKRLDLSGADLYGASLYDADLYDANLRGADLYGVILLRADLRKADLCEADLRRADLSWADLCEAELCRANLRGANLRGANLYDARLRGGNLREADLYEANLYKADLRGADMDRATLYEANLREAKWDTTTTGLAPAPEGTLIGWGTKSGHIVKMEIPVEARRSCATSRKHRAEYVRVLEIDDGSLQRIEHASKYGVMVYEVGQIARADKWDDNRWNECSHGIHFFLSRHEAEMWL